MIITNNFFGDSSFVNHFPDYFSNLINFAAMNKKTKSSNNRITSFLNTYFYNYVVISLMLLVFT